MASSSSSTPSPVPSGVRSPSYPLSVRDPQFSRRNPRSNLPVPDTTALLLRAAYDGDIPQVKTLAKRLQKAGKNVEQAMLQLKGLRYKRHGLLHMAASAGKAAMCRFLIKDLKLKVDVASEDGLTPLILAIYGRASTAVARILLDHCADPNKEGKDGLTPLHAATVRDNCETAELLFSRQAYVDPVCKSGATPLYIAAKKGNARMMELLLRHQADPNRVVHMMHTSHSSLEGLELTTKAGADVSDDAMTPLIAAATSGLAECIKCLLKAGADPNITYRNGMLPIEIAAVNGWQECVEVLFPVTTPSARVTDWSITGIIQHGKLKSSKPQGENDGSDFEAEGDDAYSKSDYAHALTLYTMALENNPNDSTLYAKRTLCSLQTGDKGKALDDANTYKDMQPVLSKSCYAQGAALILVKEYGRATEALISGLKMDFGTKPTDKET